MPPNITTQAPHEELSNLLFLIGQPVRLQILTALGIQEACVCHLEAVLGMRQAALSQHLMILRKANLVISRREGRNIFYSLANPDLLVSLRQLGSAAGVDLNMFASIPCSPVAGCPCPMCNPEMNPAQTCQSARKARTPKKVR
jgi:DNA-binding transcriptional ArsR family regulator